MQPAGALRDDRQVRGGQDRDDAWDRERRRGIDALDQRMRREGEDGPRVEQAADIDVGRELCPPGHLGPAVDARDGAPDRGRQGVHDPILGGASLLS